MKKHFLAYVFIAAVGGIFAFESGAVESYRRVMLGYTVLLLSFLVADWAASVMFPEPQP